MPGESAAYLAIPQTAAVCLANNTERLLYACNENAWHTGHVFFAWIHAQKTFELLQCVAIAFAGVVPVALGASRIQVMQDFPGHLESGFSTNLFGDTQ